MILIYIICKNKIEGEKIGLGLLKKKLIACYNLWPVNSTYWWQKKIVKDKEAVLLLKTLAKNYPAIEKWVKKWHSYQVPCIFSLKPGKIEKRYFDWLNKEIQ